MKEIHWPSIFLIVLNTCVLDMTLVFKTTAGNRGTWGNVVQEYGFLKKFDPIVIKKIKKSACEQINRLLL